MALDLQHPLCPDCGYDLVGSVHMGGGVCPECGCKYTLGKSAQALQQQWTPAVGYRRAVTSLAIKSLILLPVCTVGLCIITPALWLPPYWITILVLAIAGYAMGFVICLNLSERSGLASPMLGLVAAVFVWAVVLAAAGASHFVLRSLPNLPAFYAQTTVAFFACLWILREFVLDG